MVPDNVEEIKLKTGESTDITLKGLGTTGFTWNFTTDTDKPLVAISKEYGPLENYTHKIMGGSADEIFIIKALAKGVVNISFVQKKIWEKNTNSLNSKTVKVTVE